MKDLRMEVRIARMNQGVKYTALFNIDPFSTDDSLFALDGKRVTITNIITGRYDYRVYIGESMLRILPNELSEWREE